MPARFIFHGNAMPLGGLIHSIAGKPAGDAIPGPPASALTVAGGRSRATSRGSSFKDAFRWGATLADSRGEVRADGHRITTVTSSVADVFARNNPFVFEAGLLRITMVSDHPEKGEPSISPTEIVFGGEKGIRLDGERIEVDHDGDLLAFPSFGQFEKEYRRNDEFFRKYQKTCAADAGKFGDRLLRNAGGYVYFSIVRGLRWKNKKIKGHVLRLKGFGRIYFGEVLMNECNRRITMVRLAMGSDIEADVACGEADPNGTW